MNNYEKLCAVLKTNSALTTKNGDLLKNKVQELARKMDSSLLNTLLSDEFTADMFFVDINGIKVFDANKFTYMVESQAFLPDSYTRFKQNIMLTDGSRSISRANDVVLEFPNKDCVLEFDSTDTETSRNEVFLNETLMKKEIDTLFDHKAFANAKKYDKDGIHSVSTLSMDDNLVIKGNNLLALHSLYPKYKGKIKLMYWDILYNTQNDKVPYNDSFKHSSWLTMMKNRLEIAKKLLKDDGVICLQCDDNEQAYLTVLCDEMFGRENRLNTLVVEMASSGGLKRSHKDKHFLKTKEYVLVYKNMCSVFLNCLYNEWNVYDQHYSIFFDKNDLHPLSQDIEKLNPLYKKLNITQYLGYEDIFNYLLKYKDCIFRSHPPSAWALKNVSRGEVLWENNFKVTRNQVVKVYDDNYDKYELLMRVKQGNKWGYERLESLSWNYYNGTLKLLRGDLWKDYYKDMGNVSKEGSVKLSNGKKPERLISDLIYAFTEENDIVLDAYLGSGTTAAVAHKMNRRYIGIEQLDSHSAMGVERLKDVIAGEQSGISKSVNWNGGGSFIFFELAKNSQKILDKVLASDNSEELSAIYDELKSSPFVLYTVDIKEMEKKKGDFLNLTLAEQKDFLLKIVDKNTLYINYSDIDNGENSLSELDKAFTRNFYKED